MKTLKIILFVGLSFAIVSGAAVAADPPKKDKLGYYPPAGTAPSYLAGTVINQKTGKPMTAQEIQAAKEFQLEEARRLAEAERQRLEAERLRQEEERRRQEARGPVCPDFEYVGANARPVSGGPTGWQCPPGYDPHMSGLLCECRWGWPGYPDVIVYTNEGNCRYAPCQ